MNTSAPSADVVICTRDRQDDLRACLRSIEVQRPLPTRVILVAGSDDSCPQEILDQFPTLCIRVVECFEHNISRSRNAGLDCAQAQVVLFIDDDARARQGWVQAYLDAFDQHPQAWAIGGDVFDSRHIPPTPEFIRGLVSPLGKQIPVRSNAPHKEPRNYFANVKGCNFGVRRQAVMGIGGFDPFFAFAFDESDLILRIHRNGAQVAYAHGAIVDHAHTPGHYRFADPLDRDWRVEYASHTMFMLKHASGANRIFGRLVVYRRLAKLTLAASWGVLCAQISLSRLIEILRSANQGIRDATRAMG